MFLKSIIICSVIYLVQSHGCKNMLAELANYQMLLISCITKNSVPVTVCGNCQLHYQNILKQYDALLANCADIYFDKDRINLVASTESVLTGLWSKAYCDDCSNNNNRKVFEEKNISFYDCLDEHTEKPCENCKLQYLELNNFYINLDQHNNGEVCYDLQDSMNRTRNKWSKDLKCCRREQNLTLFVIVLAITLCLPMLFYGTTFCITKRQERYQRVIYNENPYNSEVPTPSRRYNINNVENPTQTVADNLPSTSTAGTINPVANTSLAPNDIKKFNSDKDTEEINSSEDELLLNSTFPSKEKIKNI